MYGIWKLIAWAEGITVLFDGATFFARGDKEAHASVYQVLKIVPGSMKLWGTIMMILAAYIFYTSSKIEYCLAIRVQLAVAAFSTFICITMVISWNLTNKFELGTSLTKWLSILLVSLILAATCKKDRQGTVHRR